MLTARIMMKVPDASRSRATRATMPSETARPDDLRTMPAIREAILRVEGEYREMPGPVPRDDVTRSSLPSTVDRRERSMASRGSSALFVDCSS